MNIDKKYMWMWVAWIVFFLGIELAALRNNKTGDTLSEQIRELIGTNTTARTFKMWIARSAVAALLIWLIPHFFTGSV